MPASYGAKSGPRTYYVVFQKTHRWAPWYWFLGRGARHCWIFYEHTPDSSIKIEPLANFIDTDYWPTPAREIAVAFLKKSAVIDIVKIILPLPENLSYTIHGFINCVTLCKFALGVFDFFIFTPEQLRKHLLKLGGRSLKNG